MPLVNILDELVEEPNSDGVDVEEKVLLERERRQPSRRFPLRRLPLRSILWEDAPVWPSP